MQGRLEKIFFSEGLKCIVILTSMGYRCGYVGIEPGHPLYGSEYASLDVHGGITYSKEGINSIYPINQIDPIWWLGFDCAHFYDAPDIQELQKILPEPNYKAISSYIDFMREVGKTVRSEQYVISECILLTKQLEEIACDDVSRRYTS